MWSVSKGPIAMPSNFLGKIFLATKHSHSSERKQLHSNFKSFSFVASNFLFLSIFYGKSKCLCFDFLSNQALPFFRTQTITLELQILFPLVVLLYFIFDYLIFSETKQSEREMRATLRAERASSI